MAVWVPAGAPSPRAISYGFLTGKLSRLPLDLHLSTLTGHLDRISTLHDPPGSSTYFGLLYSPGSPAIAPELTRGRPPDALHVTANPLQHFSFGCSGGKIFNFSDCDELLTDGNTPPWDYSSVALLTRVDDMQAYASPPCAMLPRPECQSPQLHVKWPYDRLAFEIYLAAMRHGSFALKDISRRGRRSYSHGHRHAQRYDFVTLVVEFCEGLMLLSEDTIAICAPSL